MAKFQIVKTYNGKVVEVVSNHNSFDSASRHLKKLSKSLYEVTAYFEGEGFYLREHGDPRDIMEGKYYYKIVKK